MQIETRSARPASHEVLAVLAGAATPEPGAPQGEAFAVAVGDVLVLPARTGHRPASDRDGSTVVGASPRGDEELRPAARRRPAEVAAARERVGRLDAPPEDPVGGEGIAPLALTGAA